MLLFKRKAVIEKRRSDRLKKEMQNKKGEEVEEVYADDFGI